MQPFNDRFRRTLAHTEYKLRGEILTTGGNIAKLRKQRKWTQGQLAKVTGLSRGYIASIEQGRRCPALRALAIIADVLGVKIRDLKETPMSDTEGVVELENGEYLIFTSGKIYLIQELP